VFASGRSEQGPSRPQSDRERLESRLPLVVINHGSIGKRDPSPRWRPMVLVQWFVSRGFVVAVPMRRGHASSDGEWAEGYGPCATADYTNANLEAASDIRAAVTFMATRPNVDAKHTLLVGVSTGGFSVLALASASPQWEGVNILGAIDFAGGRGSLLSDGDVTRHNCAPDALVGAAAGFGQRMTIPTLWLYAENDRYFPPPLARQMFAEFSARNSLGTFVQLPPFGVEGHAAWQSSTWEGDVTQFIDRIGVKMPTPNAPPRGLPSAM